MAIVTCKFDTVNKSFSVDIDGKVINDVKHFTANKYYSDENAYMRIELEPKENDGMQVYVSAHASTVESNYEFVEYVDKDKTIASCINNKDFHARIAKFIMNR